jgi:hypothetical protein
MRDPMFGSGDRAQDVPVSLHPESAGRVPEETARVARAGSVGGVEGVPANARPLDRGQPRVLDGVADADWS